MKHERPSIRDLYAASPRRDAWRAHLLHAELAEQSAKRREAVAMRWAIAAGIALGAIGSFVTYA